MPNLRRQRAPGAGSSAARQRVAARQAWRSHLLATIGVSISTAVASRLRVENACGRLKCRAVPVWRGQLQGRAPRSTEPTDPQSQRGWSRRWQRHLRRECLQATPSTAVAPRHSPVLGRPELPARQLTLPQPQDLRWPRAWRLSVCGSWMSACSCGRPREAAGVPCLQAPKVASPHVSSGKPAGSCGSSMAAAVGSSMAQERPEKSRTRPTLSWALLPALGESYFTGNLF